MARSIVSRAPSYKCRRKLSTLKTRWREYGKTAGFLYLLAVQRYELIPLPVTDTNFTKRLLKQANDIEHIREFLWAYQYLCKNLEPRRYGFPSIRSVAGELSEDLACDPFPKDVVDAIKKYKSLKKIFARNPQVADSISGQSQSDPTRVAYRNVSSYDNSGKANAPVWRIRENNDANMRVVLILEFPAAEKI
jgi:hypothetical protein